MNTAIVPSPQQTLSTEPRIGASSAESAIGLGYSAPIDVWLEKTGRKPGFEGNEKTRWGQVLEPVIRAHYVETHNVTVYVPPTSIKHAQFGYITATPDGIVVGKNNKWEYVAPQVKNVGLRMAEKWEDEVPECYLIQAVVEMAVTNLPRLDFAVLIGGQEYIERTVHRDLDIEESVIGALQDFWSLVIDDIEPVIDGSEGYRKHLMAKIKRAGILEATKPERHAMERWREIVKLQKALDAEENEIKAAMLAGMAERQGNKIKDAILGTVSLSEPGTSTKWKEVAEACGCPADIIALHTSPSARKLTRPQNWTK